MFVSYAQNQEDVVLYRLTRFVERGTYVDVGAAHPVIHNVTYALYLAGWRGINVEPMATEAEMLRSVRPEDITFQVAVGAAAGSVVIHTGPSENRGASTARTDLAAKYRSQGQIFSTETVEMVRLETLLDSLGTADIHILKIDVEGLEREVLEGVNFSRTRPWVLVVESTRPNTTEDSSHEWEALITDSGYVVTLFDGLNKFYVREDLESVQKALSVPANVFDEWISWELDEARRVLGETSSQSQAFAQSLLERAEISENYAAHLESLLNKANGWLPARVRTNEI
jgi:FkbM family methyltransferase